MITQQQMVAIGEKVNYKYPLTACYRDGHRATVISHGEKSKAGIPHRIRFEDGVEWDVFPDEITPIS